MEQFIVYVTEEQPINGSLMLDLIVTANDSDSDAANGAISYSIIAGTYVILYVVYICNTSFGNRWY